MRISNAFQNSLEYAFHFNFWNRGYYNRNSVPAGISLVATKIGGRLIVPTFRNKKLFETVFQNSTVDNIFIPLFIDNTVEIRKTGDSIINRFFSGYFSQNVDCIIIDTSKGYKYLGGPGFIFTEDKEPLIICGYEVNQEDYPIYTNAVCIINPSVFSRDDIISKCIVKKIIPFYSNNNISINQTSFCNTSSMSNRVKIIITPEINNLVHKTPEPKSIDEDNTLYSILESHMESVTE